MRIPPIIALLLLCTAGCASKADELLPIPQEIKGASRIFKVEVTFRRSAIAEAAAADAGNADPRFNLASMIESSVREAAEQAGLTSGRALDVAVEIDAIKTTSASGAMVGRDDRMQGSVYLRDAATGASLGQLYVDIDRNNGGFIGLLSHAGDVRSSLIRQFGREVAKALGGRERR